MIGRASGTVTGFMQTASTRRHCQRFDGCWQLESCSFPTIAEMRSRSFLWVRVQALRTIDNSHSTQCLVRLRKISEAEYCWDANNATQSRVSVDAQWSGYDDIYDICMVGIAQERWL